MAVTSGDAISIGTGGRFVTVAGAGDVTPPANATVAFASRTAASITVSHAAPDDADYAATEIRAISIDGGETGSATATVGDTSVTISDLTPGCTYIIIYWTEDAVGNKSDAAMLVQAYRCLSSGSTTTSPLEIEWWRNRNSTRHGACPWHIDPELPGNNGRARIEKVRLHAGQLHNLRLRGRIRSPVKNYELLEVGVSVSIPKNRPHGKRGDQ